MHIFCKTEHAILLLGVSDDNKVKYFPHAPADVLPGIVFDVRSFEPINVQLQELAATFVGKDIPVDVIQDFSDTMPLSSAPGSDATVYLATCSLSRSEINGPTINLLRTRPGYPYQGHADLCRCFNRTIESSRFYGSHSALR